VAGVEVGVALVEVGVAGGRDWAWQSKQAKKSKTVIDNGASQAKLTRGRADDSTLDDEEENT